MTNKKEEKNDALIKRENVIISLLINPEMNNYIQIMEKIKPEDFKLEKNREIAKRLYEHFDTTFSALILYLSSRSISLPKRSTTRFL